ncbi:MAG: selenide, water dikinase SelD [Deltaproteobacteria bacterium]|nr:selenide, water dikinase SelD [Deltaproteobacteria bacterium]
MAEPVRLTQHSHGAGCGCKLSPRVLEEILAGKKSFPDERLLVGNSSRDDAAVYDLGGGQGLVSTTDFFMPIVDDPVTFGRIAAANAISDVYAMGGRPILAIGILGWPIAKLSAEVAGQVVDGARDLCREAGISLAGGHSIDSPEPIFGLAVNGLVPLSNLKRNDQARPGDLLLLTKPLGVGLLTTAEKRGLLREEDVGLAARQMCELNRVGEALGFVREVHALTDVTGFGLIGHLQGMCAGSKVRAELDVERVPTITDLTHYLDQKTVPGGTMRNLESHGSFVEGLSERDRCVLFDPQTSGGLLISVSPDGLEEVVRILAQHGLGARSEPIGRIVGGDGPMISNRALRLY